MKYLFILILAFKASFSFGQNSSQGKDSIQPPIYDTTNIDIQSTNSFYFCSKLYAIPRICDDKDQSKCCSFSAHITNWNKGRLDGQISCYNGTSLSWQSFDTEEIARQNFEGYPSQMKKQMKKFKQEEVKFFVCDNEVKAYRQSFTTLQGYDFTEIIFYGAINGQNILGHLSLHNKEKSSSELTQLFQQILRF
jgi:hypothetical protein